MYRLVPLRRQGGSESVLTLPKKAILDSRWPNPGVPLRPTLRGASIVLSPDPLLLEISKVLEPHRDRIRTALVYGSYARGDWDPVESDIDLLIIAEPGIEEEVAPALRSLLLSRTILVSAQFYTPEQAETMKESRYFKEVFRTGVPLWAT